jgi:hypothetical protein
MKYPKINLMKKLIIIALVSLFSLHLSAQHNNNRAEMGEKYQAQKIAYITTVLELTPEESVAFWPLYNEHEKKHELMMDSMKDYRKDVLSRQQELTQEEAKEAIVFFQTHMAEMQLMETEYQNKYLEVLPAKKVLLLMKAEKDFRRELLKKLGEKRGQKRRD